jgi:hypothetical protein
MSNDQTQKAFEIGTGESFKDDWNLRAQILGADEVAALGPSSYKLFAEHSLDTLWIKESSHYVH